jgi:hypothetical protein
MLSPSVADQAGAAKEAPRSHAYRWSSDKQPRTRPSGGSWCYEGLSAPSLKLGADGRCIANVSVSPIHKHFGSRIEDTQTHSASGRRPGIFDKLLQWRTANSTVTGALSGFVLTDDEHDLGPNTLTIANSTLKTQGSGDGVAAFEINGTTAQITVTGSTVDSGTESNQSNRRADARRLG